MKKTTKIFAILLVAWQVPMAYLWYLTYEAVKLYCHKLEMSGNYYSINFKSELVGQVLWQNAAIILALVACFVLPLLCMIFLLRKKCEFSIPVMGMLGASILICFFVVYWFNRPYALPELDNTNYYTLCEFMFFRYTLPEDIFHTTVGEFYHNVNFTSNVFPHLQKIKFVILSAFAIFNATLLGLGIGQLKHKKVADTTGEESVDT